MLFLDVLVDVALWWCDSKLVNNHAPCDLENSAQEIKNSLVLSK